MPDPSQYLEGAADALQYVLDTISRRYPVKGTLLAELETLVAERKGRVETMRAGWNKGVEIGQSINGD